MTEQEYNVLISLLNRTPLTPAEALWLNALMLRLRPQPQPEQEPKK